MEEEVTVRYIPTSRHPKLGWNGNKPALCFIRPKEKKGHCIINDESEIRVIHLPIEIITQSREVELGGVSYPVRRFVERLRATRKPIDFEAEGLLASLGESVSPPKLQPISEGSSLGFSMEDPEEETAFRFNGRPLRTQKSGGPTLISRLAEEFELPQPKLRRFLREKGLRAPYTDEDKLRAVLKTYEKEKTRGKTKSGVSKSSKVSKGSGV